ncbi:regulator of cell morphogenesis and NO signaling [Aquimarina sp. MAR_2010_214]|uniref:iron-sulfur cluster repair di-iron protein n=1 Tax=Aquimarina sp. MAR_2010_214 TaxID=1250026 RepID=UPI000C70674C|nr:iron-sulfur cluster repair di-iron protein [Aquimarina sp. MAR_2010_214]PKV49264.1 regulator of cell morphogenesis and NO signaling [Aquimarina sp. MAR_2010_214]
METLIKTKVGQFVAKDYRTAVVFSKHGIDFCCRGDRTLEEVCNKNGIEIEHILESLNDVLTKKDDTAIDYQSWPLDLLADYIEKTHHRYVEEKIPIVTQYLGKLCKVHGGRHQELLEIYELFHQAGGELTQHMKKEEIILFPFIRKMVTSLAQNNTVQPPHFGTVENPIGMMMQEHDNEGERFRKIASLTDNYTPPEDACNTYRVTFSLLEEFEKNLHLHIHLENNILFPKAVELEKNIIEKSKTSSLVKD